ncbi:hypothetical protein Tco_1026794 [Tanacetum coccineum]
MEFFGVPNTIMEHIILVIRGAILTNLPSSPYSHERSQLVSRISEINEVHKLSLRAYESFVAVSKKKVGYRCRLLLLERFLCGGRHSTVRFVKESNSRLLLISNSSSVYSSEYLVIDGLAVRFIRGLRANSLISSIWWSPRSGIKEEKLLLLIPNTSSVILPNISDRWSWLLVLSGDFSVKSTREFIDDSMLPKTDVPTRWVKYIPIKINIFAWRVSLDKLPTRLNISL